MTIPEPRSGALRKNLPPGPRVVIQLKKSNINSAKKIKKLDTSHDYYPELTWPIPPEGTGTWLPDGHPIWKTSGIDSAGKTMKLDTSHT